MQVLGLGDNIIDRFLDRGIDYPGGNAVNVAVYAKRLGADAAYLGVFGSDEPGRWLRRAIEDEAVVTDRSVVREGESGVSNLHVVNGDRTFLGWNGGGVTVADPIDLDDSRLAYAAGFDLVHTSVYSGTVPELARLAASGAFVSFDFSSEPEFRNRQYFTQVAPHIDLALVSCSEQTEDETRAILSSLIAHGAGLALATRGTDDAIVTDGDVWITTPTLTVDDPADLVDTMGCGDAFLAGFAVSLLRDFSTTARSADRSRPGPEDRSTDPATLERAMRAGAAAARDQCFVEAAFGHGRPTPTAQIAASRAGFPAETA